MKVGLRTPSIKKSIKARTTGKYKRKLKRLVNPFYGKKGMGWIKNPSRALKNKIYHKTTFSVKDASKGISKILWLIFYPVWIIIKYTCIFTAIAVYYMIFAMIWLIVALFNGIIALIEWLINIGRKDNSTADTNMIDGQIIDVSPESESVNQESEMASLPTPNESGYQIPEESK